MTPPRTRSDLRALIKRAELRATLLRQPGFHRLGTEERRRIADDLTDLAHAARRLFGDAPIPEIAPALERPALHDAAYTEDDDIDDLFGRPA